MQLTSALYALVFAALAKGASAARLHARQEDVSVHCGTTNDATFSDCQALMNSWDDHFNTDSECHYSNVVYNCPNYPAYNVACLRDCCVYYASGTGDEGVGPSSSTIKSQAQSLFGCADTGADAINVMGQFPEGHGICISNGDGCGDCFDDMDFHCQPI